MTALYQITGSTAQGIADCVEDRVRNGGIAAGSVLPPVRALAAELGVSPGTVAAAYRVLRDRGLTIAEGRRGTAVRPALHETVWSRAPAGEVPAGVVDLSGGNPDPALLPKIEPALARLRPDTNPVLYGAPVCSPALTEAAAATLRTDNIPVTHLTATFGALDAIRRVLSGWLRPGDRVAVEDPGWPASIDLVRSLGMRPVPVALDSDGPVPDSLWQALAAGADAAIVTARAQNPTGAAITAPRAAALRAVLARYPATLLLEDDHGYGMTDMPLSTLSGATERFAFIRSPAKAFGPDLRVAVVAGDEGTVGRVEGGFAVGAGWVSHLTQALLVELWHDPEVARALARAAATYDDRRWALGDALSARGVNHTAAASGLNCWVPVVDEAAVVSTLLAGGWLVAPGGRFRIASPAGIRVTTATLPIERAGELATAIAGAMRRRPGPAV